MDILLYLTELLQTRKTVGIAGLGTLYKKKSPGKYDTEKHAFVPPSYRLAFTKDIKEQEELAHFISQKRNITLESAHYYINEFAERIQSELAEKQEVNLDPLGKLTQLNGEINFTPTQESNIGFEFYGLPEVTETQSESLATTDAPNYAEANSLEEIIEENKLQEENPGQETEEEVEENVLINDEQEVYEEITDVQNELNPTPTAEPIIPEIETVEEEQTAQIEEIADATQNQIIEPVVENKAAESLTPVENIVSSETEEYSEEETKRGMPFFLKFFIAFLIIVALGAIVYFINPQFFNNYFNKKSVGEQETARSNDSLSKVIDTAKTDSLAINDDLVKLSTDTVAVIDSSKVTVYEVLVSAVATDKKANKIIANLAAEGVKARKIKLSKTMINISAGSFLANDLALKYRDSLRIKLKNQGVYIQPIKPKTHKK